MAIFDPKFLRITSFIHTNIQVNSTISMLQNSKKQAILMLCVFMILKISQASNCGGNCPGNNCPLCPCGTSAGVFNSTTFCSKASWDQKCCKCIVERESRGNIKFVSYNETLKQFSIGSLPIRESTINATCPQFSSFGQICSFPQGEQCAFKIFSNDRTWKYWSASASACGCPFNAFEEENLGSQNQSVQVLKEKSIKIQKE